MLYSDEKLEELDFCNNCGVWIPNKPTYELNSELFAVTVCEPGCSN